MVLGWLIRRLPSGLPLPIVAGPLRGRRWLVDAAPGPSRGLSVCLGRSEPGQMRAAAAMAFELQSSGGGIAFDIGAHTGVYSLLFAKHGLKTFAFEPLPRNLGWLYRTLTANHCRKVTVVPWGMGETTGLSGFAEGEHHSMGHLSATGEQPAMVVSLPDFCERYGVSPDLIKMDVEGGEAGLLRGGKAVLEAKRPALLLSTHGEAVKKECFDLLQGMGYARFTPLDGGTLEKASEFLIRP